MILDQNSIQRILRDNLGTIKTQFHVMQIGLFGSYARNEQRPESDIDILIEIEENHNDLFTFIRLKNYLEDLFQKKVDLAMKNSIKPKIKEKIYRETMYV